MSIWNITLGSPDDPEYVRILRNGENITDEVAKLAVDASANSVPKLTLEFLAWTPKERQT